MLLLHPIHRATRPAFFFCAILGLSFGGAKAASAVKADGDMLFARKILPLFEDKCLACHGRDEAKIKSGFDLRTRAGLMEGGDSGLPAIVPGKPKESPLYLAVTREHSEDWEPMPPKENDRLSADQIAYIADWISAGAPWPEPARIAELAKQPDPWAATDGVTVPTSGGLSADWTNRKYKPENLWAFEALKSPGVPAVAGAHNPIDAFLGARFVADKITPAPAADRRTLLRRVTFDLIGLPPTPEETAAFLADSADDATAFGKVVERLLASPHYGEQWAQHWLDIARYADSSGFANDFVRGAAWRYRDYVVRAFNGDKPYDQFIREQLAGDEIAAEKKLEGPAEAELLVATGFLRSGPWELTAMEVPKVARQKYLDDVTDCVGQVFLAQPMQCARCHDHKFDPIPTRDYYSLQAIFATTQLADREAAYVPGENTKGFEEKKYLMQRQEHYRAILRELDKKSFAAARAWFAEKKIDPSAFEHVMAESTKSGKKNKRGNTEAGYAEVRAALLRQGIPEDQIPPKLLGFSPQDYGLERISRKGLERIRWELDRYEPIAFSVYSGRTPELRTVVAPLRMPSDPMQNGELEQTCILPGGDPFSPTAKVQPAVLSAATRLGGMDPARAEIPAEIEGRRLALADWIAAPENPLTARVIVNRVWLWHFGQAIAGNPNNFGATGKKPTNPALLDWLAWTFVHGDAALGVRPWSIKSLHRLVLNSEAYRRAAQHPAPKELAERDPDGTSFAVFKPRRLTAEEVRDTMLKVSGELNETMGGIPVRPEMNREAALQPRQVMGTFAEAWQPSPKPEQRNRRSIYVLRIRGQLDPFMEVFNAPSPDLSCEARAASTVTPQAFALLNGAAPLDRAVALAARVQRETKSPDAALARVFELAYGRAPTAKEQEACRSHWTKMTARHRGITVAQPPAPKEVLREAVDENTGEKFTFIEPLEAAADFVPDLKLADVPVETRGLAEVCLVLFNSNEFAFVY